MQIVNRSVSNRLLILAVLCALALGQQLHAGAPATNSADLQRRRAQLLIDHLGDADSAVRRAAQLQLNSLSGDVLDVVEKAAARDDLDPETQIRLRSSLAILRPRARLAQLTKQVHDWELQQTLDAYDRATKYDDATTALAHTAIIEYMRVPFDPKRAKAVEKERAVAACKAAWEGGAVDWFMHRIYELALGRDGRLQVPAMAIGENVRGGGENGFSALPAAVKLRMILPRTFNQLGPSILDWQRVPKLFGELAKQPGVPEPVIDVVADRCFIADIATTYKRPEMEEVMVVYRAARPKSPLPLALDARDGIDSAWRIRTVANYDDGKTAEQHLKDARNLCEEAWKRDAASNYAPSAMLALLIEQGEQGTAPDPQEFELWFKRAVITNPDNRWAYDVKLTFLLQNGDDPNRSQAAIAFGNECLESSNYLASIPFVLIAVHDRLASTSDDSAEYFAKPEVWIDVQHVYDGALLNFPNNLTIRSGYAKYAARCGQWSVVAAQCKKIGDHPALDVFGSLQDYEYLREKAGRLTRPEP